MPQKIDREGSFIAYDNGVVYDIETGLEWVVGPDKDTTWDEANAWVESLTIDGGGWRMPTDEELPTLYKKRTGTRNMTPLLKTTGWFVWSDETEDSSLAWGFDFNSGFDFWLPRSDSDDDRVFAVRSRKKSE